MTTRPRPAQPLAIIGIGCLFPKADGLEAYWANIREGIDAITDVPPDHWRPEDYYDPDPKKRDFTYGRRGGFLSPYPFDPMRFGIPPNALEATDTAQLLAMAVAEEAMRDAGYGPGRPFDRDRVSVILGVTGALELVIPLGARLGHPVWRRAMKEAGVPDDLADDAVARIAAAYPEWQEASFPGLLGNVVAGRVSKHLDLGGTNCVVDAACASSLGAVHLAALELESGKADLVVTGGVDTFNDIFMYMCFSKTPALSPTGDARPFDHDGDGTTLGEGLGVLVLKRLKDAERDGDRVYAVLKGIGASSDGKGEAVYAPNAEGQQKALREAYARAAVSPETIQLVEAHGTGTKRGDAVEVAALKAVFGQPVDKGPWCALGSVKSQIGHTKAAAGAAGLIKAALALHHKVLPPTIKVEKPQEAVAPGATPFYVNTLKRPWLPNPDHPRRAAVSSFGFGGSNFHCVLEEHDSRKARPDWDGNVQIIAINGKNPAELKANLAQLPQDSWTSIRAFAAQSRNDFNPAAPCRLLLVLERDLAAAAKLIAAAAKQLDANDADTPWSIPDGAYYGAGEQPGRLAAVFPGQGAQYVGMMRDLACAFPEVLDTLAEANAALRATIPDELSLRAELRGSATEQSNLDPGPTIRPGDSGRLLHDFIYPYPVFDPETAQTQEVALRDTRVAQPAIGAVSLGAFRLLRAFGFRPAAAAGHSYGELTALCAAGRLDAPEFFRLSELRGRLMARGEGDRGAMLALRAPLDEIAAVLDAERLDLVIANKNAPDQAVLSGPAAEIERAERIFKQRGIRGARLAVSAAFHGPLVAGASAPFEEALRAAPFNPPQFPVYANTTAGRYPESADEARQLLARQLARPVEFVREIETMYDDGARVFVEIGPGARLTALIGAILGPRPHAAFALDASNGKRSGIADLARALARLAALGYPIDLRLWDAAFAASQSAAAPDVNPSKTRFTVPITGANYRAPRATPPSNPPLSKLSRPLPPEAAPNAPTTQPVSQALNPAAAPRPLPPEATYSSPDRSPEPAVAALAAVAGLSTVPQPPAEGLPMPEPSVPVPPRPPRGLVEPARELAGEHQPHLRALLDQTTESLLALQRMQEQTAALHKQYLEGQETASKTLQLLIQQQQRLFDAALRAETRTNTDQHGLEAPPTSPRIQTPPPRTQAEVAPAPQPLPADAAPFAPTMRPTSQTPQAAPSPGIDVAPLLLEIVSEKTGYPADMLELDMALDADLGIDSIKRVEILSTLQERCPSLPAVEAEDLGRLQTLRDVVDYLSTSAPQPLPAEVAYSSRGQSPEPAVDGRPSVAVAGLSTAPQPPTEGLPSKAAPSPALEVAPLLLEIVSEKTGYPAEMLELDMALDADLGIDSIKRVEILSTLQERCPSLPAVEAEDLGRLQTLRDVVNYLATSAPQPLPADAAPFAPTTQPASHSPQAAPSPAPRPLPAEAAYPPLSRAVLAAVPLADDTDRERLRLGPDGVIWITDDGSELARAVARRLELLEYCVDIVPLDPSRRPEIPGALHGLVILAPEAGADYAFVKQAFQLLQSAAPALRRNGRATGAVFATVSRMDGAFGLDGLSRAALALAGALAGFAKTAALEWPEVACKALDLGHDFDSVESASAAIVDELCVKGPVEVGLAKTGKRALETRPAPLPARGAVKRLAPHDVIVVTGGARGVTAECAAALAKTYGCAVALLGRSPAPVPEPDWLRPLEGPAAIKKALLDHAAAPMTPKDLESACARVLAAREIEKTMRRIRETGARAVYQSVDVRDADAVRAALDRVRAGLGPITGLVHGAGVLADRKIEDKTPERFDAVFDTKVIGFEDLLAAIEGDSLKILACFSSSSGRYGRAGQADYAAANEVLNKLAQIEARKRPDCRVVSINWGPWDGGMVTPPLRALFEKEGLGVIPLEAGAQHLIDEIEADDPAVEVVVMAGNLPGAGPSRPTLSRGGELVPVFELDLDLDAFPVLRSHVIDGKAVLPVALYVEWFAHAALHGNPGLRFRGLDDLRVLKGVVIEPDGSRRLWFNASKALKTSEGYAVSVELRGRRPNGKESLHARASVVLSARHEKVSAAPIDLALRPYGKRREELYAGGALFHGELLRGIQEIEGLSESGVAGLVHTAPRPAEWMANPPRKAWLADPLVLDAAFQMLVLWTIERHGAASLPTALGRYRQYQTGFPKGRIRVAARVVESGPHKAVAGIDFIDPKNDALIARLDRYECVIDAALDAAFRRNQLVPTGGRVF